jgi:hypothetical protein
MSLFDRTLIGSTTSSPSLAATPYVTKNFPSRATKIIKMAQRVGRAVPNTTAELEDLIKLNQDMDAQASALVPTPYILKNFPNRADKIVKMAQRVGSSVPTTTAELEELIRLNKEKDAQAAATLGSSTPSSSATAASVANGSGSDLGTSIFSSASASRTTSSTSPQISKTSKDPVFQAFNTKAKTAASAFSTNSTTGGVDPLKPGTTYAKTVLSADQFEKLATIAARLGKGGDVNTARGVSDVLSFAGDLVKTQTFTPEFLSSGKGPFEQAEAYVNTLVDDIEVPESLKKVGQFITKSINSHGSLVGAANDIIEKGVTEGLPLIADEFGKAIPNIPINLDPNVLNALKGIASATLGIATDAMCSNAYPYGYNQNLFNSLLGFTASEGILCMLMGFLQTNHFNATSRNILRNNSWDISNKGMASILNAVAISVGPGTLKNSLGMATNIVRKGYTSYDAAEIADTIDTLGLEVKTVFAHQNKTIPHTIWNPDKINAANSSTVDHLTQEEFSVLMNESRELEIPGTDLPWNTPSSGSSNIDNLPWLEASSTVTDLPWLKS